MSFSTYTYNPENIMRYISAKNINGKTHLNIDWQQIYQMLLINDIPLHQEMFTNTCIEAIETHICKVFAVPKNKPNAIKVMPYMVALVIFETTKIILKELAKPEVAGDTGDNGVDPSLRVEEQAGTPGMPIKIKS